MTEWNNEGPWGSGGGDQEPQKSTSNNDFDELFRKGHKKVVHHLKSGGGSGGKKPIILMGLGIFAVWLAFAGVYSVEPYEQGVVLRFGKFHRFAEPGLHYHIPYPIETVKTPDVTSIRKIEIGYRSPAGAESFEQRFQRSIPAESLMLTGDQNIVDVKFEVQWKVSDAKDYLFNIRVPEETVKAVAESGMREIIGQMPIGEVLASEMPDAAVSTSATANRQIIQQKVLTGLQNTLNSYNAGVEVVRVQMLLAYPPEPVMHAFRDVQNARTDMERKKNEGEAYANDIIPRARGKAAQMLQQAQAYKQEVVARSEGEAARFLSVYNEYKLAKEVTKKRIYLESLEEILKGMDKVIMDSDSGVVPYLPLKELGRK